MSNWIEHSNVDIFEIYKKVDTIFDTYLFKMRIPKKDSIFSDYEEFAVSSGEIKEKINSVIDGDVSISYMSNGMQDIDFYKMHNGKFGFTFSPHDGLNIRYIINNESIKKLKRVFQ